jgi:hypothetical protein
VWFDLAIHQKYLYKPCLDAHAHLFKTHATRTVTNEITSFTEIQKINNCDVICVYYCGDKLWEINLKSRKVKMADTDKIEDGNNIFKIFYVF